MNISLLRNRCGQAALILVLAGAACGLEGQALWADGAFSWTWMKGASTANPVGVYGTEGIPSALNTPGGRSGGVSCGDASGTLWVFGGHGYDGSGEWGALNDLWEYDPAVGDWAWIKGASTEGQAGTYGIQGTPDPANTPGARDGAVLWMDASGALWLFGGEGYDAAGTHDNLNDLWKYDPATGDWTWMKGVSTVDQAGIYGTQGIPGAANTPGARRYAVSWSDPSGALWLFGGLGVDDGGSGGFLNDLWRGTQGSPVRGWQAY